MSCNTFDRNPTRCDIVAISPKPSNFAETDIIDLESWQRDRKAAEQAILESSRAAADIDSRRRAYPHGNELRMVQEGREHTARLEAQVRFEATQRSWWKRLIQRCARFFGL